MVICKLRSETTERHRQHWRAAKALLVIFPLLGISYIITLVGPTDTHRVFQYVRALLLSLQVGTKQLLDVILDFFFKAPHQTTEYINPMDRFWGNKNFFGNLID